MDGKQATGAEALHLQGCISPPLMTVHTRSKSMERYGGLLGALEMPW